MHHELGTGGNWWMRNTLRILGDFISLRNHLGSPVGQQGSRGVCWYSDINWGIKTKSSGTKLPYFRGTKTKTPIILCLTIRPGFNSRDIDRGPGHVRDSLKTRVSHSHQFPNHSYGRMQEYVRWDVYNWIRIIWLSSSRLLSRCLYYYPVVSFLTSFNCYHVTLYVSHCSVNARPYGNFRALVRLF